MDSLSSSSVYICRQCSELIGRSILPPETNNDDQENPCCRCCLGLHQPRFAGRLQEALAAAARPYHKPSQDDQSCRALRFSRNATPPSIIAPGDVLYRFQMAMDVTATTTTTTAMTGSRGEFAQSIKRHTKTLLLDCLDQMERDSSSSSSTDPNAAATTTMDNSIDNDSTIDPTYPNCVRQGELGYLAVHVIVVPQKGVRRPDIVQELQAAAARNKRHRRNKRKLDAPQQGGDPRINLEARIPQHVWTLNQADAALEKQPPKQQDLNLFNGDTEQSLKDDNDALEIHVAIWRRPFYLASCYTKTRRDVSQTPFFVTDHGKRHRLGATSVEEQILPVLERYCHGISTLNNTIKNDNNDTNNGSEGGGAGGDVRFGMAKFHASGREDLDVRMIVPSMARQQEHNNNDHDAPNRISGRPFVCEIIDAFSMPLPHELKSIVNDINHEPQSADDTSNKRTNGQDEKADSMSYGKNPMGVGIAPSLHFCSPDAFKNLQAQTEDKVKHYGCLCWSKDPLPKTDAELNLALGSFPLELQQRTPLRVLHRRSNLIRTRHVLTCSATRVDNHYFRLHLSTDAGTYVKEFVHGDLGRTVPSVSKLLNSKTDILELDCEGIQIDD